MFKLTDEELRLIANYFRLNKNKSVNGFKLDDVTYSEGLILLYFEKGNYKLTISISKYFMNCRLKKGIDTLHDFEAKSRPKVKDIKGVIMTYTKLENYKSNEEYINVNIDWDKEKIYETFST